MDCHESLMARRRKRSARNTQKQQKPPTPNMHLDKSLPSLPPSVPQERHQRAVELPAEAVPPELQMPTDARRKTNGPSGNGGTFNYALSEHCSCNLCTSANLLDLLPPTSFFNDRASVAPSDSSGEAFIPLAFDPTPKEQFLPPAQPPRSQPAMAASAQSQFVPPPSPFIPQPQFTSPPPLTPQSQFYPQPPDVRRPDDGKRPAPTDDTKSREAAVSQPLSRRGSRRQQSRWPTEPSDRRAIPDHTSNQHYLIPSELPPPSTQRGPIDLPDGFKLQDVPKRRPGRSPVNGDPSSNNLNEPKSDAAGEGSVSSSAANKLPSREISEAATTNALEFSFDQGNEPIRYLPESKSENSLYPPKRLGPTNAFAKSQRVDATAERVESRNVSAAPTPQRTSNESVDPVMRPEETNQRTQNQNEQPVSAKAVSFADPSTPKQTTPIVTPLDGDSNRSSHDEAQPQPSSFIRRMSNSVWHTRSYSDRGSARTSPTTKWPKSPGQAQEISSPDSTMPEAREELAWYKNEIQKERQKVIARDQRISELEKSLSVMANITQVNTELHEKRSTMVVLDAQKAIALQELEALTAHISAEKNNNAPLDMPKMTNTILQEFVEKVNRLKDSFAPDLEELMQRRGDLVEEVSSLNSLKDKSIQEFEQLSSKNAQLAELNNQLVHQIQSLYKANSTASSENSRSVASDTRQDISIAPTLQEDVEPVTLMPGPQVVNIRKGQPRKFNWKRGGQKVTKGIKGAFSSREEALQLPVQDSGQLRAPHGQDPARPFGFFGNQRSKPAPFKSPTANGSSTGLAETGSFLLARLLMLIRALGLFGVNLETRIEAERCVIPGIVTRCIEEVELRGKLYSLFFFFVEYWMLTTAGMDVEGIYRKSGGSSQVQMIRDGFEQNSDFDISDPDIDIHAVTSALKQYFRKLPMPLITFEVYDKLLETNSIQSSSNRVQAVQQCLLALPRVHRDVLEFLIFHLKRVVERESENLMTSMNIAVVFAPTILRPESISREMTDMQRKNDALRFLVEHCQDIFMGMGPDD